ncbi:hypothetical protein ACP4OV_029873 [Aristida adscensionis]
MDADGSPKTSRPGRRPTKKLKFKPKVPPQKPKKSPPEKLQNDEPKPIDEALMKILRVIDLPIVMTHQVTEKTSPNTKDELLTRKSPSTPPCAAAANLSSSAVHKQNESRMLYKESDDDDDDDSDNADNDNDDTKFQDSQLSSTECEASIRPAEELNLLREQDGKERMFLFQLPKSLPLPKRYSVVERKGKATGKEAKEGSNLQQLPHGYLGKMLVYKSGKIKMKLGDVMFDVNPGAECSMVQHAVALNTREKHCCMLGEIENRHVIVTPDVDSLLNGI